MGEYECRNLFLFTNQKGEKMKLLVIAMLTLFSINSMAASSGSYECKVEKKLSTKAYEAGPVLYVLVDGMDLIISSPDFTGSCEAKAKKTNSDFIIAESAMKGCGTDGVDMLIPTGMQEQDEKATLVVSSNGTFDVYSCKLNAMIEF